MRRKFGFDVIAQQTHNILNNIDTTSAQRLRSWPNIV